MELVTRVDGREDWSKAIRFYSPKEKRIVFISVSTSGDYYVMTQDVDTEIVRGESQTSDAIFRFVIVRKTADEQDVVMELSHDGGKTWTPRRNQYMQRVQ